MIVLYFTATGNSLYVAKRIGVELSSIPKAIKTGNYNYSDKKIALVFPIYGLSVPAFIEEFLHKVKLDSSYVFAVMSYGFYDGGAANHLLEIAKRSEITFSYINTVKMVDNYLPTYNMEKQIKNEPKKQIEEHLDKIIADVSDSRQWIVKNSGFDKLMTKLFLRVWTRRSQGIANSFSIEDTCTKCAVCAKVCPVDNVRVQGGKPEFGSNCISCLACTQNCPQNAIRLKGEKSTTRFRNKNITLKDIVDAND